MRLNRIVALSFALCALPFLCATPVVAQTSAAQTAPAAQNGYNPAETTVVILPCVDRTGEKLQERRERQARTGYRNEVMLFAERGFKIAPRADVDNAIKALNLNLDDEEDYRRENFYKVADAVKADLVVFSTILGTQDDKKTSLFGGEEKQGKATVKVWFLDARSKRIIFSAVVKEGKSAGKSKLFATNEGTDRRANAVGNAIKEQFEDFLKPYPVIREVKLSNDGTIESVGDLKK